MYRCTECQKEYEQYPGYCDCGNDEFEEIINYNQNNNIDYDEEDDDEEPERKLTKKERLELAKQEEEKKKSLIVVGIVLILSIFVLILPPHRDKNTKESKTNVTVKRKTLPSVSTYWIDDLSTKYKKNDPFATLQLLNDRFKSISPELRKYLMYVGRSFNSRWNSSYVEGSGDCKVQFVLNKEGGLDLKNIVASSGNKSLDDSVLLLLSQTVGFSEPPSDYRGEKIYILFSVDRKGISKVTYPSK